VAAPLGPSGFVLVLVLVLEIDLELFFFFVHLRVIKVVKNKSLHRVPRGVTELNEAVNLY
jgi:hypothetical protein